MSYIYICPPLCCCIMYNMTNTCQNMWTVQQTTVFLAGRHKQRAKSQTALENSNNTDRHRCSQHHIHCYV